MERKQHPYWKFLLVAISTFLGTVLAVLFKIPYGFLICVTSFVLIQLFVHELWQKSLERMIGPIVFSALSLGLVVLCQQRWILSVVGCALLVFVAMYAYAQKWHLYGMLLGGITSALIVSFYYFIGPHEAEQLALYWPLNIILGVVCILPAAGVIWLCTRYPFREQHSSHSDIQTLFRFNPRALQMALRITVTIALVIVLNKILHKPAITLQGLIAGVVVSAQFDLNMTHHRLLFRVLGVVFGCAVALAIGVLIEHSGQPIWQIVWVPLMLMVMTFLADRLPVYLEYGFLQAGVMVPLILMSGSSGEIYNTAVGIDRALGSIEGGIIGLLVVYFFRLVFGTPTKM